MKIHGDNIEFLSALFCSVLFAITKKQIMQISFCMQVYHNPLALLSDGRVDQMVHGGKNLILSKSRERIAIVICTTALLKCL